MNDLQILFVLLAWLKVKHFLADYPLQTPYMLKKFAPGWDFMRPLLAHVGVHGLFTYLLCRFLNPAMWWLCFVDMGVHFVMDRIKAGPKYLGRFKALSPPEFKAVFDTINNATDAGAVNKAKSKLRGNTIFWWSLGFDQMVHGITDLFVLYMILVG